ncbi:cbb3-type cytochrome oxidase assembly protein CcoS [soil metagenome]
MTIIYLLIGLSLTVAVAFLWAIRSGQYDDDYTPSVRMLFENEPAKPMILSSDKVIQSKKQLKSLTDSTHGHTPS